MVWISLSGAHEVDPSCYFSSLCTCSKSGPDLGIVRCQDVHLPRIPETLNISKVFMLHLENNNLKVLEPYFLQSTGMHYNTRKFLTTRIFIRSLQNCDKQKSAVLHPR